jgi:hypothetical protein
MPVCSWKAEIRRKHLASEMPGRPASAIRIRDAVPLAKGFPALAKGPRRSFFRPDQRFFAADPACRFGSLVLLDRNGRLG